MVFNLMLFVDWPAAAWTGTAAAAPESLTLCASHASVLLAPLLSLHGRRLRSLQLNVRRLAEGLSWAGCQAVYADAPLVRAIGPVRPVSRSDSSVGPNSVFVIGDEGAGLSFTPAVLLRRSGPDIVFDVNLQAAHAAGLQFSSKLLRLAQTVKRD